MKKRADGRYVETMTIDGKRKFFYGASEREVRRKIKDYVGEKAIGKKFSEVASEWKEEHFKTIRNGTKTCYTPAYNRAVECFGEQRIGEIETREIYAFIHEVIQKKYSQKTVKTQKLVLNQIFNYAIICGEIDINPVTAIRLPSNLPKKQRELPSDEMIDKIKNGVKNHFGLFAYLIIYTGCRRGEALALQYEDIDRKRKVIKITKSLEWVNNVTPSITLPKTNAGTREIILLDKLIEHMPNKEKGLLFPSATGSLMPYSSFARHWKKYCKESGLTEPKEGEDKPVVTPHQLRHYYATVLYEAGIDEKMAQELLGHANIAVTRDIYTHIRKNKKDNALDALNRHLKGENENAENEKKNSRT